MAFYFNHAQTIGVKYIFLMASHNIVSQIAHWNDTGQISSSLHCAFKYVFFCSWAGCISPLSPIMMSITDVWYLMLWCGCEIAVRCWKRCLCLGGPSPTPTYTLLSSLHHSLLFLLLCYSLLPSLPTWGNNYAPLLHMVQQFHLLLLSSPPPVSHWVFGCADSRHCPSPPCARLSLPPNPRARAPLASLCQGLLFLVLFASKWGMYISYFTFYISHLTFIISYFIFYIIQPARWER